MTQSTSHPSSPNDSDSSNAAQYMSNTGMPMGQFPYPQLAYIPHPGFYYPYGVAPNALHGAAPSYAPVAPSPGVGAGVEHHAFQAGPNGYYPPAEADVTNVGPNPPLTEAAPPPQCPSAPPPYHQPFPSNSFPGAGNPCAPPAPHQGYLPQNHEPGLPTTFAPLFVPQAPSWSVGQKRVAEDLEGRDAKRTKQTFRRLRSDPLFKPVLDQNGQPNGTFVCSQDGLIINPQSYLKHLKTRMHLGFKLERYKCPGCIKTFARRDSCKRHWDDIHGKLAPEGARQSYADACKNSTSSASAAPVTVPTTPFTYSHPYPMPFMSMPENMQIAPPTAWVTQSYGTPTVADPGLYLPQPPENNMVTEPAEDNDDEDDADFWEVNEIRDVDEM
ncbi:hypothetical protein F4604DRAFT_152881 [Suillus subluteus]|nr:hypothetical protein F4604DRAFT_152881 [Suillus subluteus]